MCELADVLCLVLQQLGIGSFNGENGSEEQNAYQAMMQVWVLRVKLGFTLGANPQCMSTLMVP